MVIGRKECDVMAPLGIAHGGGCHINHGPPH